MSLVINSFTDKVRLMNQTHSKQLVMSADEARNLHTEIFTLLSRIADLTLPKESVVSVESLELDGGGFSQT